MKYFFISFCSIFILNALTATGQRNIIDIPTSEIVEKKHMFFQTQVGIGDRKIKFNAIGTYGFGKNWEGGLTINHITYNMRPQVRHIEINPESPEDNGNLMINLQKGFQLSEWYNLGLGTRNGFGFSNSLSALPFVHHSFINNRFKRKDSNDKVMAGLYYGNQNYLGKGNSFGFHIGAEKEIIKEKLEVFAEFISGINSTSVINTGFQFDLPREWEIDIAAQLPAPHSGNTVSFVFQIARR